MHACMLLLKESFQVQHLTFCQECLKVSCAMTNGTMPYAMLQCELLCAAFACPSNDVFCYCSFVRGFENWTPQWILNWRAEFLSADLRIGPKNCTRNGLFMEWNHLLNVIHSTNTMTRLPVMSIFCHTMPTVLYYDTVVLLTQIEEQYSTVLLMV